MIPLFLKEKTFLTVGFFSLMIAWGLGIACWDMNIWPTDAEAYYMPAAKELPQLKYLSQIHQSLDEDRIKWLHGKEMHVLAIAIFQRLMGDTETLRPLLVLGIVCIFFSSLLIFVVGRRLWGERTAALVWVLFATSFWPYLYILFTKHQTQGLLFFLLALFLILNCRGTIYCALAGVAMGVSIFSSTVSMLYVPFVLAALVYADGKFLKKASLAAAGFSMVLIYANYPNIMANLSSYWKYVQISGQHNHFFYNQKVLVQWLPSFFLKDARGGWVWICKYFWLMMPVIVPLYIASAAYFLKKNKVLLVLLSLSPVLLAEIKGVAQYGANYFPALFGMLMLIGYVASSIKWRWKFTVAILLAVHVVYNGYVFAADIYPCRMATTLISRYIEQHGLQDIFTFRSHPLRPNIIDHLNPRTLSKIKLYPVDSLVQAPAGHILLPPVSTDSIYRASNGNYNDFDEDLVLNQMVRQGKLRDYAVASFPTFGSSIFWSQEEEIFAFRTLVLGQGQRGDLSRAWILDAAKIQQDRQKFLPTEEDLFLFRNHVQNIGTSMRQLMYTGYQGAVGQPTTLKGVVVRMFKMGEPWDQLTAFVYRVDEEQPMWVPYAKNFISQPVSGNTLSSSPAGGDVVFKFDPPLEIQKGLFSVVIYREGKPSDTDFYRIYADALGRVEE